MIKSEKRKCQNCKNQFIIEPDDFSFYERVKVPPPTFCPECRRQRRWAWRNSISLYNRTCKLCDKSVISLYHPDSGITVYCNKCWWSDKWDPKSYGQEYDFSKPFFTQFKELVNKVPHMATINDNGIASVNCEYTNDWWFSKNCYMAFSGWRTQDVMYSFFILSGKEIVNCMNLKSKNEVLYGCIRCATSYRLKHAQQSKDCLDSSFLDNCSNCSNCFLCGNLKNKKFYYKNQPYSEEEYKKILDSYRLDTYSGLLKAKKEFDEFIPTQPKKHAQNFHNTGRAIGEEISYSKNLNQCFVARKCENCSYGEFITDDKECFDVTVTGEIQECYESVTVDHSQANHWGLFSVKSQDLRYTQHCHSSKHLFGCVGLKNASYCILNKQYSKEEYEQLVPKIIAHMNEMPFTDKKGRMYKYGEYYPAELSYFGYNETHAMEINPLTKEAVKNAGYNWQDNLQITIGKETLKASDIPDSILDVKDDILEQILACVDCNRNYKVVPNELIFHRKMSVPISRQCFHCRYKDMVKRRNPWKLFHRTCMCQIPNHFHGEEKCKVKFETFYAPERPETVYCEKCYQQEVY